MFLVVFGGCLSFYWWFLSANWNLWWQRWTPVLATAPRSSGPWPNGQMAKSNGRWQVTGQVVHRKFPFYRVFFSHWNLHYSSFFPLKSPFRLEWLEQIVIEMPHECHLTILGPWKWNWELDGNGWKWWFVIVCPKHPKNHAVKLLVASSAAS